MNLAWLAAVLQPRDVGPHPNFRDDDFDTQPVSMLAALVMGNPRHIRRESLLGSQIAIPDDDLLALANRCLHSDTIFAGVASLSNRLLTSPPADAAEAAAFTLVTCSAASELDDYATCFSVIEAQLARTQNRAASDDALLTAAVLQQKALRLRDAGLPYITTSLEAAEALQNLDVAGCSAFKTSPGVSWRSQTTLDQIRTSLLSSIESLIPVDAVESGTARGIPTWQEIVRSPAASVTLRAARDRAETYSQYVAKQFNQRYGSRTKTIGGPGRPDLFSVLFLLELAAHNQVYSVRKEVALLRLVQPVEDPTETADALRLLRHAAAKNELELALNRIRYGGPLAALSADARQILRTRLTPQLLRSVELQVLTAAADLLAPAEARAGLAAVQAGLAAGGPPDLPGQWQMLLMRKEASWVAAAALSRSCAATDEVAGFLLDELEGPHADGQILDRSMSHAVSELDWSAVTNATKRAWMSALEARAEVLPGTAEIVFTRIEMPVPANDSASPLERLADDLNSAIRGGRIDPAIADNGPPRVREALNRIREAASQRAYSFGGINAADVAAGLILVARVDELWPDLVTFLTDLAVHRDDRSAAFERLARSDAVLPPVVAEGFRAAASQLLFAAEPDPTGMPLFPYPEALRFLSTRSLIADSDVYDGIATLAGQAATAARREAAITLAALARAKPRGELLAMALPLTRDDDVDVRAHAGRVLALLASRPEPLAVVAQRRLAELLAEDGLLVPLLVLRELTGLADKLPPPVRQQIENLIQEHPSRAIRDQAAQVIEAASSAS